MPQHTSLRVLEADGGDKQEWLALLDSWPGREVFAHPNYLALYAGPGERAVCAVYTCREGRVIYPLLVRDLRATSFWGPDREELYDTVAPPFGYGGPFVQAPADQKPALVAAFFREYERWAQSRSIVSEYITFSPKEEGQPAYPGTLRARAPTVVRALDLSPEELLHDYRTDMRRDLKLAQQAGVRIVMDQHGECLNEFLAVYEATMERRDAKAIYHLTPSFLTRLTKTLQGHLAYWYALLDGRIVSTVLVLLSADSTFFFRGGTLASAFRARSNQLLVHSIFLWSRAQGKRFCFLGGGNDPEDSLYRYKLRFAPSGARPLWVGKWILNSPKYEDLLGARRAHEATQGNVWVPKPEYFPAYRAPAGP